jgi:hypothetical protein
MRSFVAVATSPAMPRWPEYRDRVTRERGVGPAPGMPTAFALARALGPRPLIALPSVSVVGSLVSFLDDHSASFPRACFPAEDAEALFDALTREPPHTTTPERLLTLALRRTDDGLRALLACHLATRHLARGRDTRAFHGLRLSLEERCDVGLAIAPFPPTLACGGDPLGDTYHYFANVIAGVLAVHDVVLGSTIARLFHAGPDLMHWIRERTFGRPLFFGNHAAVDRCGLAHGMTLAQRYRRRPTPAIHSPAWAR